MAYIDPTTPDADLTHRRDVRLDAEARQQREAMGRPSFDDLLFRRGSTYNGSAAQVRRLAARAGGRPVGTGDELRKRQEAEQAVDDD